MLTGFFDETVKQKGERLTGVTGVGGFLFKKEELNAVQQKLRTLGPSRSIAQERYYRNHENINSIAKIVADDRGEGFICTVLDEDFSAWQNANPSNAQWLGKPYSICLLHVVDIIARYLEQPDEEVFYFFESGAEGKHEAKVLLDRIMDNENLREKFRMRDFLFIPKDCEHDGPILRGADLLVNESQWNYRQIEIAESEGLPNTGIWSEPMRLLFKNEEAPPIRHYRLTRGSLRISALWVALHGLML